MSDSLLEPLIIDDGEALAIGRFMLAWREIEGLITGICLALYTWSDGRKYEPKGPPRSMARKLTFIGLCFANDTRLADRKEVADLFRKAAAALAGERDFMIHHVSLRIFSDFPPVRIALDRTPWPEPPPHPNIRAISDLEPVALYDMALDIMPLIQRLAVEVITRVVPNESHYPLSEPPH
jgi:hypothetical protein